jgi:hypothetical protein
MSNFQAMNKGALRQACREAGISYKGLDVAGMRNALELHTTPAPGNTPATVAADIEQGKVDAGVVGDAAHVAQVDAGVAAAEIEENIDNGVAPRTPRVLPDLTKVAPVAPPATVVTPGTRLTSKGVKIEKDRPVSNGVKMPSAGTACRQVWDYLSEEVAAGRVPDAKSVKAHATELGWNANNASIEYYNWRKFNGISGRAPKPKSE